MYYSFHTFNIQWVGHTTGVLFSASTFEIIRCSYTRLFCSPQPSELSSSHFMGLAELMLGCNKAPFPSLIMNMTITSPVTLKDHLEQMWQLDQSIHPDDRSLATEISLVCRAFSQLKETDQNIWAERAASCIVRLCAMEHSPLLAFNQATELPQGQYESSGNRPDRQDLLHQMLNLFEKTISVPALVTLYQKLPVPTERDKDDHAIDFTPGRFTRQLFRRQLPSLLREQEYSALNKLFKRSCEIPSFCISDFLTQPHLDKALSHPLIYQNFQSALKQLRDKSQMPSSSYSSSVHKIDLPRVLYTLPGKNIHTLITECFLGSDINRLDLEQIHAFKSSAYETSKLNEAYVAQKKARYGKSGKNLTIPIFSVKEREIAFNKAKDYETATEAALQLLATRKPAECMQYLLDQLAQGSPERQVELFATECQNLGLTQVNAYDFLFGKVESFYKRQPRSSSYWPRSVESKWTQDDSPAMSFDRFKDITLNPLECLFFDSFSQDAIEKHKPLIDALYEQGYRCGSGFDAVIAHPRFSKHETHREQEMLWIVSYAAQPYTLDSKPVLRL